MAGVALTLTGVLRGAAALTGAHGGAEGGVAKGGCLLGEPQQAASPSERASGAAPLEL